jgi:hypothetical protein
MLAGECSELRLLKFPTILETLYSPGNLKKFGRGKIILVNTTQASAK